MINASKEYLTSFFQSNIQYIVPFFQRPYVWIDENWETLWENVSTTYENYKENKSTEHFIGTLINKQRAAESLGQQQYDIIDGQQRLTTIAILLKALEHNCKNELPKLKEKIHELIVFEDAKGVNHIRIRHNRLDTPYFEALLLDKDRKDFKEDHKIFRAFNFFCKKTKIYNDEEINNIKDILLNKVPIISMLLSPEDDEQVIFDTINSLGVKLTTAELLKNYIFKEPEIQDMYDEYWLEIFENDDEQIDYWNRNKTSGRVIRTNIEILLYCFLIIKTQKEVKLETLFKEYKNWLNGMSIKQIKDFLIEFKEYALLYYGFPDKKELNEISFSDYFKRFFHIIENLSLTTIYPLILFLVKFVDSNELKKYINYLESYIVRRNICKLTTKNYNNLFISIMQKLIAKDMFSFNDFEAIFNDFNDETNKFPDDKDFKESFEKSILTNQNAREILYCIALYQISDPKSNVKKLSASTYSVEHIMPKQWVTHWNNPELNDNQKRIRNSKLLTLGNLTLITKRLNSQLKNDSWDKKKMTLKKYSTLYITTKYLDFDIWNENKIDNRCDDLFNDAINIWKKY